MNFFFAVGEKLFVKAVGKTAFEVTVAVFKVVAHRFGALEIVPIAHIVCQGFAAEPDLKYSVRGQLRTADTKPDFSLSFKHNKACYNAAKMGRCGRYFNFSGHHTAHLR